MLDPNAQQPTQIQKMEELPSPSQGYVLAAEQRSLTFLNPKLWQAMVIAADTFIKSSAIPNGIKNAPQAIMVMQAGYEMGLQPVEALNSFAIINGKLSLYGETAISQVIKHGHKVEFIDCDATKATCRITRKDDARSMQNTFTMDMAVKRGLANKEPYQKWPENMMKFKAFHMTAKFIVPEVFHGVPLVEEVQELEPSGIVITGTPDKTIKPPITAPKAPPKPLDAALDEEDAPVVPPKAVKPAVKPKKDVEPATEETKVKEGEFEEKPPAVPPETDEEKAARLIDSEIKGEALTHGDKMWLGKFQATRKTT